MNKYAVISTDNNPDYYNLVPLCCYSWEKLGFEPLVYIIGDVPGFDIDEFPIQTMTITGRPNVKDSTLAQLIRLFSWYHPKFQEEDVIITGDCDMIQAKDFFCEHIGDKFVNFGYDLTGRSELPICYNLATAKVWRELMGEYTIPEKAYSDKWEDYWSVDQQLLTKRAKEYGFGKIKFVDRGNKNKHGLPTGRWDRHDWNHIPDDIIDVHMKRNDPQAQLDVFNKLWPNDDDSWLRKFLNV